MVKMNSVPSGLACQMIIQPAQLVILLHGVRSDTSHLRIFDNENPNIDFTCSNTDHSTIEWTSQDPRGKEQYEEERMYSARGVTALGLALK